MRAVSPRVLRRPNGPDGGQRKQAREQKQLAARSKRNPQRGEHQNAAQTLLDREIAIDGPNLLPQRVGDKERDPQKERERIEAADLGRGPFAQPSTCESEDDDVGARAAELDARVAHRQFTDVG